MSIGGALLVDKPRGPTSHDIVALARRALQTPRVGHTGTLDPLASGLLVLLVGHATRVSRFLVADEKEYLADIRLGISTPTYDAQSLDEALSREGREDPAAARIGPGQVQAALAAFRGTFQQMPPPFSAKKVDGVRAYKKARRGDPVELKPVEVTVRELEVADADPERSSIAVANDPTLLRLRIVCSAGFYVRSLAHDLGQRLGCGAHLEALRRTRAGRLRVDRAMTVETLQNSGAGALDRMVPLSVLLDDLAAVTLTDDGLRRAGHGNALSPQHVSGRFPAVGAGARVRVLGADGDVLAVAEVGADGLLHPLAVLR